MLLDIFVSDKRSAALTTSIFSVSKAEAASYDEQNVEREGAAVAVSRRDAPAEFKRHSLLQKEMHAFRLFGRRLAHTKSLKLVGQRQQIIPKMSATDDLDALRAAVTKAGGVVRQLKAEGAEPAKLQAAIDELQTLRKKLDVLSANEEDVNKWKVSTVRPVLRVPRHSFARLEPKLRVHFRRSTRRPSRIL